MKDYPHQSDGSNSENFPNSSTHPTKFWEFVDSRVQSQEEVEKFCEQKGFSLSKRVASGGFGSVYSGQDVLDGTKVAIKVLDFCPHHSEITTQFWMQSSSSHCEVYVETAHTIQDMLAQRPVLLDIKDIIPFIIGYETIELKNGQIFIEDFSSTDIIINNIVELEYIKYPQLVEYLCKEDFLYQLNRVSEKFLPGILELWLYQILDNVKLRNISLLDLWNLAPQINCEFSWQQVDTCYEFVSAYSLLFPQNINFSLKEIVDQSRKLFADHGRSLISELLYGLPYNDCWKFSWIPEDWERLNNIFLERIISFEKFFINHSLKEIRTHWPDFFKLKYKQNLPAGVVLKELQGDLKNEVKRLLAVKHETITANAMQFSDSELNQVLFPPQSIGKNNENIIIISKFLWDWTEILPSHFCYSPNNTSQSLVEEEEKQSYLAFPAVIFLVYYAARLLLKSNWILGDIKPGNFKMTLTGEWKLIDYGGHFPKDLFEESYENLVGSNDYSCYSLFHLLNMPSDIEVESDLVTSAKSLNSRWFSLVKVAVRMMTGKVADYLRGTDLNRALLHDFQGYQETIFQRLIDSLINKLESVCHYKHFSLVEKDVDKFFLEGKNLGLEIALRRFLFLLGMSLTGYCPYSLLDEEMQRKLIIKYTQESVEYSTWKVLQEEDKIIVVEYSLDACRLDRKGLHPEQAIKLMELLFPGISKLYSEQYDTWQKRQNVLNNLQSIGLVDVASYFNPPQIKVFLMHVQECFKMIAQANWLDINLLRNLWNSKDFPEEYILKLNEEITNIIQTRQVQQLNLNFISHTLEKLRSWQEQCFKKYILVYFQTGHNLEMLGNKDFELIIVQSYILDRYARVQYAWEIQQQDLLENALADHWIEKKDITEICWLENVYQWIKNISRSHVLVYHELNQQNYSQSELSIWEEFLQNYRKKVEKHLFYSSEIDFTGSSIASLYNLVKSLSKYLNKNDRKKLFFFENLLDTYCLFPWANLFIIENMLDFFYKSVHGLFQEWHTYLKPSGYGQWAKSPKDYQEFIDILQAILQQLPEHQQTFMTASPLEFENFSTISLATLPKIIQHLSFVFSYIHREYKEMENYVHCHFLMSALSTDQLPLEYLYQKLKKLTKFIHNDFELEYSLSKLQWDLDFFDKELGKWHIVYHKTKIILEDLEKLCHRWSEYANAQGWTLTTIRQNRHSITGIEIDQRALFEEYNSEVHQDFVMDQLKIRLGRFIMRWCQNDWQMGTNEQKAISQLFDIIYQYGLLLKPDHYASDPILANIYQLLRRHTEQFKDIPSALSDIKKISLARWKNVTAADLRNQFLQLLPEEVQEPNFTRSVLLEFLQYQADLSRVPQQPAIRKKILSMQLQREHQELQKKYAFIQQQYPEQLLSVTNLALVKKDDDVQTLLKEAQEIWSYKIQVFSDYLKIEQRILEIESQQIPWNWREFFKDSKNKFLLAIYPELKNPEISDIFLTIFDLNPLPDPKEIKDFMQKCYHFHLQEDHRNQIREILSNSRSSQTECFDRAKAYLDVNCIPWAEEEVRRILEQVPVQTTVKEQFWQKYFDVRKQMAASRRIKRENRFLDKIHQSSPEEIPNVLLLELWLNKFCTAVEISIVYYFFDEFEQLLPDTQQKIYESLANASQSSDIASFFNWLFHYYLFNPTLQLLDNASIFGGRSSEQILSKLVLKYKLQDIPVRVQAQLVKSIKEKLGLGWPKPQIVSYIYSMIE